MSFFLWFRLPVVMTKQYLTQKHCGRWYYAHYCDSVGKYVCVREPACSCVKVCANSSCALLSTVGGGRRREPNILKTQTARDIRHHPDCSASHKERKEHRGGAYSRLKVRQYWWRGFHLTFDSTLIMQLKALVLLIWRKTHIINSY